MVIFSHGAVDWTSRNHPSSVSVRELMASKAQKFHDMSSRACLVMQMQ